MPLKSKKVINLIGSKKENHTISKYHQLHSYLYLYSKRTIFNTVFKKSLFTPTYFNYNSTNNIITILIMKNNNTIFNVFNVYLFSSKEKPHHQVAIQPQMYTQQTGLDSHCRHQTQEELP